MSQLNWFRNLDILIRKSLENSIISCRGWPVINPLGGMVYTADLKSVL